MKSLVTGAEMNGERPRHYLLCSADNILKKKHVSRESSAYSPLWKAKGWKEVYSPPTGELKGSDFEVKVPAFPR